MATKKEEIEEVTHESLMNDIVEAEKFLIEAKATYKEFCKENPLQVDKQLTPAEIRNIQAKMNKKTDADHKASNKAAQAAKQKAD